jgi:hypothetical protein
VRVLPLFVTSVEEPLVTPLQTPRPLDPRDLDQLDAEPLLTYEMSPAEVKYSASADELSIVRLTLSATNPRDTPVDVTRIEIQPKAGGATTSDALTTSLNVALITITPGPATPWAVLATGDGRWLALPLPPALNVGPHETLTFSISNVVVNEVAGRTGVNVAEVAATRTTTLVPVHKTVPVDRGGVLPRILTFSVEPTAVAANGDVTISWTAQDAVSGVLQPGGTPLPDPNRGRFKLPVDKTTTFMLDLLGTGGQTSAVKEVVVMPVRIESFVAKPATPVNPADEVTLVFDTAFANAASIDQGVGIVPLQGQVVVKPTQTTVYTLTAFGLQPQTRAVTVTVLPPN